MGYPRIETFVALLKDFLEPNGPGADNEWGMHCPLHDDTRRSASLNLDNGMWFCYACNEGGKVETLIYRMGEQGIPLEAKPVNIKVRGTPTAKPLPDAVTVQHWHQTLLEDELLCNRLMTRRSLNLETLTTNEIGWAQGWQAYTIPVYVGGTLVNVRYYQFDPPQGRRKIWSVMGHGKPQLYPIDQLQYDPILICEGEWDALLSIQNGIPAVTRTGGAKAWKAEWTQLFTDKTVYVCHDCDSEGQAANAYVAAQVATVARQVHVLALPYDITAKHGKDLTDYWQAGNSLDDLLELAGPRPEPKAKVSLAEMEPIDVDVLESFNSQHASVPLRMRVTVTGRNSRTYLVPHVATFHCSMDAGDVCMTCPMYQQYNGNAQVIVDAHDEVLLAMCDSTERQRFDLLKQMVRPNKCDKLDLTVDDQYSVEELFVRPAIDKVAGKNAGDYANRKVYCVGNHDDMPNSTVTLVGAMFPNPRSSHNEFQAWRVERSETDIDNFNYTRGFVGRLSVFRDPKHPLDKLVHIATDLQDNVTGIYDRRTMHQFMDLVLHSVLEFPFKDDVIRRGWLDGIIVGDTRTGKSEAAAKLLAHYGMGELVSCEGASFAGVVGGLEQVGGREWVVKWGTIPLNDRRAVVLDEVSGLSPDNISQMSSIRSSGEAHLMKIHQEQTLARTRLLWLSNPRGGKQMAEYTYGVETLVPLIGTQEDVARFDIAMTVDKSDVSPILINQAVHSRVPHQYTDTLCHELIQWVWTRTAEDVRWEKGAEDLVLTQAIGMADEFSENPPLVQGANIRLKLARLACAIAARLFSTERTGHKLYVLQSHVRAAWEWLRNLYRTPGFGYHIVSQNEHRVVGFMGGNDEGVRGAILAHKGLAAYLAGTTEFSRQDLESALGLQAGDVAELLSQLQASFVLVPDKRGLVTITPSFKRSLREWINTDQGA